jgi:glyoxylase-like metal-dependent hydrolase (beta-lactamase superfamily II)
MPIASDRPQAGRDSVRRDPGPINPGRRGFLRGATCAAASCLLAPFAVRGQGVAVAAMTLGDRFSAIAGLGGNVVVLATAEGAVVVDTGAAQFAGTTGRLVGEASGNRGVAVAFNTHWHADQTGGNAALRADGAKIVAHAKTHAHLSTPTYLPDEDRYQPAAAPEAWPTDTFHDRGSLDVGGERIDYGYLIEPHTAGDIYVHFGDRNVIAVGDAIAPERDPVFDWYGGGWLGGRIDSLERLLALGDRATRFVPGYGPVVDRAYVESEHELMLALYDILFERIRSGESAADVLASRALDALPRRFGDPGKLLYDLHKGMWAQYNTLSHDIV